MQEREHPVKRRADARIGSVLNGKWKLDRLVGVGGMAAVYAATHRNSKRVAVKILHADMSLDEDVRDRFLREGYAANQVGHPGAVDVLDDDVSEDGSAFLVMELLDGENLDTRMRRKGGRLPAREVLALADQVLDTLAAAHAKGIVHRDIKPENIFITTTGDVKILDFGIARIHEVTRSASTTRTGFSMGTPAFMPPEQARGRWDDVDARTDIWAVGATMFTLLSSFFVHGSGSTTNEALALAVTARARSVASVVPTLPPAVTELVDRSLIYEREERWQTALEMQEAVRRAYVDIEGSARPPQFSAPDLAIEPPLSTVIVHDLEQGDSIASPQDSSGAARGDGRVPTFQLGPDEAPMPQDFASTSTLGQKERAGAGRAWIALGAGAAAVAISVAVWAFSGTSARNDPHSPVGSAATVAPVGAAPTTPSAEAVPELAPPPRATAPIPPRDQVPVVSVDSLPREAPAVTPVMRPHVATPTSHAAPAPSSNTVQPTAKPAEAPAAPTKPEPPADPFSGRY